MREVEMFKNVFGEGYDKTLECMETHCDEKKVKKMQNELNQLRKLIDKLEKTPNPHGLVNRERRYRHLVKMVELVESILKSSFNKQLVDCKLDKCRKEYIEQNVTTSQPLLQKIKETKKDLNRSRRLMAKHIAKNKSKKIKGDACTPIKQKLYNAPKSRSAHVTHTQNRT